jgi:glycosyltransferase
LNLAAEPSLPGSRRLKNALGRTIDRPLAKGAPSLKITIITVSYNSAATIAATLQSVAAQNYPNIEYIVVDGGSSDGTVSLLKAQGALIDQLISEPDCGIYDAMNKGLSMATGDMVGFLNADDLLATPEVVADIARAASSAQVDAVFGDLVYVRKDQPEQVLRYWRSGEFTRARLSFGWMPPHPTLYIRRSRLLQLGLFDLSMQISADYDFMLRLLCHPGIRVVYVPKVLVRMRMGGASNRSLGALLTKSREDLRALQQNSVGGLLTLVCKNVRKIPQFFDSPR